MSKARNPTKTSARRPVASRATKRAKTSRPSKLLPPADLIPATGDREQWLQLAAVRLRELVHSACSKLGIVPVTHAMPQVSCSWPMGRSGATLSETAVNEAGQPVITISPVMGRGWALWDAGGWEDPDLAVAAHLLHELIHLAAGHDDGHRGNFARIAHALEFRSPLGDAVPADGLMLQLHKGVLRRLGPYPHVSVQPTSDHRPGARVQRNRQRKWVCEHCGKIVRAAGGELTALHLCDDGRQGRFVAG
jgi:hypothetical protein